MSISAEFGIFFLEGMKYYTKSFLLGYFTLLYNIYKCQK